MKLTLLEARFLHSSEECEAFDAECQDAHEQDSFAHEQEAACPMCGTKIASWPKESQEWKFQLVAESTLCRHIKFLLEDDCDEAWTLQCFNGFTEDMFGKLMRPVSSRHPGNWEPGNVREGDWAAVEATKEVREVFLWEPCDLPSPCLSAGYLVWIGVGD